jgi:hypothetical protein
MSQLEVLRLLQAAAGDIASVEAALLLLEPPAAAAAFWERGGSVATDLHNKPSPRSKRFNKERSFHEDSIAPFQNSKATWLTKRSKHACILLQHPMSNAIAAGET